MKLVLDFERWPSYILGLVTLLLVVFFTTTLSEFFLGASLGACLCAK